MRSWSPRRPGPAGTGNARRVMLRPVLLCAHCVPPLHRGGTLRSSAAPRVRTPTQPVVFPHVHTPAASWVGDALRGAPGSDAGAAGRVPPCAHSRRLMGGDALRGAPGSDAGAVGPVPPCAHSRRLIGRGMPSAAPRVRTPAQPAVFPRVHTPAASSGGGMPSAAPRVRTPAQPAVFPRVHTPAASSGGGRPPRRPGFGRRRSRPCSPVCTLPSPHRAGDALRDGPGSDAGAAGRVPPCAHSRRLMGGDALRGAPGSDAGAAGCVPPCAHSRRLIGRGDALRDGPGSDAGAAGRVPPCAHSRRLMGGDALRGAPGSDAGAAGCVPPCAHSRRLIGRGMPLRDGPGSDAGAAGRVPPCAHSCVSVRFVSRLSVACCCRRPAGSSTFSRMSPCPARTFSSVPLTPPRATPSGRVAVSRNGSPSSSYGPFPAPAGRASGSPSTCRTAALACSPTATRIATFRGSWRRAVACKPRPASAVAASSIRVRTRATMSCLSMMIERVVDSRMTACTN